MKSDVIINLTTPKVHKLDFLALKWSVTDNFYKYMNSNIYNYDKSYLLNAKKHLPKGIFVENEFPKEVQWSCTILRPVIKLANKTDLYKGKCKMEGHHLERKGTKYDISTIHELPRENSDMVATQNRQWHSMLFWATHPI